MPQRIPACYYEIRALDDPYPEPTALVVEAADWDEVVGKYPDAELLKMHGEHHSPSAPRAIAAASPPPSGAELASSTSRPSAPQNRQSLVGPSLRGTAARRGRLPRATYVWQYQYRHPKRRTSNRDLAEALTMLVALAATVVWLSCSPTLLQR